MVLVNRLRLLDTAINLWGKVLREPHDHLDQHKDISDEAENSVYGCEVWCIVAELVDFYNDEACEEEVEGDEGRGAVDEGASALLVCGVGGL